MEVLTRTGRGAGGEIQLTDAIADLIDDGRVHTFEFDGTRYDCGSKLGFLTATIDYALKDESLKAEFAALLRSRVT